MGQLQAQMVQTQGRATVCYRTDKNPHVAGKQQRIGDRGNGNDHSADHDNSRLSLANAQGKPSVWQGWHSEHFRRQAEERLSGVGRKFSAVSISTVLMHVKFFWNGWSLKRKHVTGTAIQTKCEEEDWEYDSISTFSRVTFVYLSMRTTGTARKIATSGKRGVGLNAWRRLFQEYNPQLVTGAQALLRRALSIGEEQKMSLMCLIEFMNWKSW